MHRGGGVVCITVCDQGDGILGTLPAISSQESRDARFARAFREGESRKPLGMVSRGLGLPNLAEASFRLHALIRVWSDDQYLSQDFSLAEGKYPGLTFSATQRVVKNTQLGTCLSIFLPAPTEHPDQVQLFRR
jgi:hypothetical protein